MKRFAKLNELNEVVGVAVAESMEQVPPGDYNRLVETSGAHDSAYMRRYPAGPNMIYDATRDAFYWKRPVEGTWQLNESTLLWEKI